MANRRRKRDNNPDGVALSEWVFFGVLLIVPIGCFGVYSIVSRICAGFVHFGDGRRYCSFNETVSWFVDAGGWWKLLIVLGVIGLLTFLGRDDKEGQVRTPEESRKETETRD
jgi:hypothetical protein